MAYSDELWQEAKRKCRLNAEDIALAKAAWIESQKPYKEHSEQEPTMESPGQGMDS